jgi:hypothetical protein
MNATARLYYERRYDEFIERCQEWVQRDPSLQFNEWPTMHPAPANDGFRADDPGVVAGGMPVR